MASSRSIQDRIAGFLGSSQGLVGQHLQAMALHVPQPSAQTAVSVSSTASGPSSLRGDGEASELDTGGRIVTPSDHYLLAHHSSPCFFVRDQFLGREVASQVAADAQAIRSEGKLRPAGMSRGVGKWADDTHRGDDMIWLSSEDPDSLRRPGIGMLMKRLQRFRDEMAAMDQGKRGHLRLEGGHTSVQLAFYDQGKRYVRHRDAFAEKDADDPIRCLTCIYYLNEHWDPSQGGQIRLYLKEGEDEETAWDVEPLLDRLLVFRSDVIEHEVLPTRGPRLAITVWFYGRPAPRRDAPEASPSAPPGQAMAALARLLGQEGGARGSNEQGAGSAVLSNGVVDGPSTATTGPNKQSNAGDRPEPLPVSLTDPESQEASVFVSIVSYRDTECQHTVLDLFRQAARPQRVYVGLVWQFNEQEDQDCFKVEVPSHWAQQVRTLKISHREAAGPCWARHLAQALWQGEAYVLQIDSHMRFRANWDAYLIETLQRCPSNKPILTTYPAGYYLPNSVPRDCRPTLLCPTKFDNDGMLRQTGRLMTSIADEPMCSPLWASGFNFSRSSTIEDAPYDASLRQLFFGEEISMAARLWTHGYDFFAPPEAVVFHLWQRSHRPNFREIKDRHRERAERFALNRVRQLLTGDSIVADKGSKANSRYGLGEWRPLKDYEELLGVDFQSGRIVDESTTLNRRPPTDYAGITTDDQTTGGSSSRLLSLMQSVLAGAS